jgi:AcrR family transcriptional regulator
MDMTRQDRKERTRAAILEAAGGLCARQGFLATRTAEVAVRAGLSHGAVFVHFPTRDALLVAVVERAMAGILQAMHERLEAGATVRELLRGHLDGLATREELYAWLVREASGLPLALADAVACLHSTLSWHLAQAAERERAAGRIRAIPDHFLFNCWIGLVHHYLVNREHFAGEGPVLRHHAEELVANFWLMIRT